MSAASRRKGVAGEREVALRFEQAGWTVRGLESSGDWLCLLPKREGSCHFCDEPFYVRDALTLHTETKRQERVRLPEWLEQARAEAPPGVPPVVVFRQSRGQWIAALPLDDLLELIG